METYEVLNKLLMPVDQTVKTGLDLLKKANLYEPVQGQIYKLIKNSMKSQFVKNHDLEVIGAENVPTEGGALLTANHQSWLDAQVIGSCLEQKVHFIAKSDFENWPMLSRLIELSESVYIRRGGDNEGLQDVVQRLKEGWLVAIFPEGTIPGEETTSRKELDADTGLLPGKTGAVRMAIMAGVPIIPVGLSGTGQAFPPEAYPRLETLPVTKSVPITIKFGKPIHFEEKELEKVSRERLRELTHNVMKEISALTDHKRKYIPIEVPIKPADHKGLSNLPKNAPAKKAPVGALVLHGFTSNINTVSGIEPMLSKRGIPYRFPILSGHGGYPHDMLGVTFENWYDDAVAALEEVADHAKKVVVIGFSMGGLVTLELGIKHPELIKAAVLIAPALKFADPMTAMTPVLANLFKYWDSPDNAFADKQHDLKYNRNYTIFPTKSFASLYKQAAETEKRLSKFKCPALIIQSKADKVVAPKTAKILDKHLGSKQKRVAWFEKSGHEMMLDLEMDAVLAEIDGYLDEIL